MTISIPAKASVYVVNHLSALDIPVLYACLPFHFRILAKKELFRYPFMGWHLKRSGQIPVVLENPREAIRSLNLAVAAVKNNMPLVIFPKAAALLMVNCKSLWVARFMPQSKHRWM